MEINGSPGDTGSPGQAILDGLAKGELQVVVLPCGHADLARGRTEMRAIHRAQLRAESEGDLRDMELLGAVQALLGTISEQLQDRLGVSLPYDYAAMPVPTPEAWKDKPRHTYWV